MEPIHANVCATFKKCMTKKDATRLFHAGGLQIAPDFSSWNSVNGALEQPQQAELVPLWSLRSSHFNAGHGILTPSFVVKIATFLRDKGVVRIHDPLAQSNLLLWFFYKFAKWPASKLTASDINRFEGTHAR